DITAAATVVTATLLPPANGDIIALGIAPGTTTTTYECSLSTSTGVMHAGSTQSGGAGDGQLIPVRGFTATAGQQRTVHLVCQGNVTPVNISGASIRLIYFPG